jgi:hypothetical protein
MADDQIVVELIAKVDGLQAGLTEAVNAMRSAVEAIKGDTEEIAETGKKTEGILQKIGEATGFIALKEKVEVAVEGIKIAMEAMNEAFEGTVIKAEEFGLSNAKFAAMMGTSETEAAGLSAALRGVGSSAEDYEALAMRMEMRLVSNEKAFKELGIATRDHNGNLLAGKDLIDSAISAMGQYKEGTDQNAFALQVFGRRAADVYDLMRVSNEDIDRQVQLYREMGVQLDGTGGDSERLESALNDLHTMFNALKIKIGQEMMPIAEEVVKWARDDLPPALRALGEIITEVAKLMVLAFSKSLNAAVELGTGILKVMSFASGVDATVAIDGLNASLQNAGGEVGVLQKAFEDLQDAVSRGVATSEAKDAFVGPLQEENPYKKRGGGTRSFERPGQKGARDTSGEDAIKTEEKIAQARIATEEATNAHLLAMGQETVDKFIAEETQLENAKFTIQDRALQKQLTLASTTDAERSKINNERKVLAATHEEELTKIAQDGESRRAAIAKEELANFLRADDERLKSGIAALQEQANLGQISLSQRDQQEMALTQTVRREQLARLDSELSTLTPGTKAYEDVVKQREKVEKQFTADMRSENAQRAKDIQASVNQWLTPITSGFRTAISDMILRGKSFGDAMKQVGDTVLSSFLDMVLQMAEHWAILQITNAIVAQSTQASLGVAQVTSNAAIGAAGAAASQAGIPIVGPALAAGAAAETFGLIMGYAPLASAAGGMVVDRDRLAYVHQEEMVIPAHLSRGLQAIIGDGGRGSSVNLHFNPQITGQTGDLSQMLQEQAGAMKAWIRQQQRDGVFRGRAV